MMAVDGWRDGAVTPPRATRHGCIRGVGLVNPDGSTPRSRHVLARLEGEFPHLPFVILEEAKPGAVVVRQRDWQDGAGFPHVWDREVAQLEARPGWLIIIASDRVETMSDVVAEVLTRYQRLMPRRNEQSCDGTFERALALHRELHDLSKPLVRADYDHALDVWQWVLRLVPSASRSLQLAALFHDIERLWSEADQRIEHRASDYQRFKDHHAECGADIAARVLGTLPVEQDEMRRMRELITAHERPSEGAKGTELAALGDADALSFFTLNSPGFADYYGPAHTRMKVRYSLGRMTAGAIRRLGAVKLRSDIARHVMALALAEESERARGDVS